MNKQTVAGFVISSYSYENDENGNRTSQIEVQDGATEITAYTYDSLDRLSSFLITDSTGTTTNTEYTFEGYNRKTEKLTTNGTVSFSKTYTYDETDWLTKVVDNADSANVRTIAYTYDKNGNTTAKTDSLSPNQNLNFEYDSLNQLVQTKDASNNVLGQYDYNAEGLRVRHRYSDRGDIDYFYDGRSVIDEFDTTNNSLLAHYNYADRLLALTTLTGVQYYHHDGLGSTVNLSDAGGTTQVSYHLDPWGHIKSQTGLSINRHIFTDKEHDLNTGLVYFGARYYDADTARFITQDSYLGESGTPPSLHRYLYAYSNPTVYVDLFGYASFNTEELFKDSTIFADPLRLSFKMTSLTLDYLGQSIDDYADTHTMGEGGTAGLTALKMLTTVTKGVVDTPETLSEETVKFIEEPKLENLPMFGGVGKHLGVTAAEFAENPNFETGLQLTGALGAAFLTVEGGRSLGSAIAKEPVVANSILGAEIKIAPKITGELLPRMRNAGQEMLEPVKNAYQGSMLGNEGGFALLESGAARLAKKLNPWNEFQRATKGQFKNSTEAATAYRAQQLLEKGPGVTFSSRGDAVKYRNNIAGGKANAGTAVTDIKAFESVIGKLPSGNKIVITRSEAIALEKALGLPTGRVTQGGIISIVEDIAQRAPRSPLSGNRLFLGGGKGLPGGGPELNIAPINSAGGGGIRQIILEVK